MGNLVIVTKQCYLICQSIHYITVTEPDDARENERLFYSNRRRRKKPVTRKEREALKADKIYNVVVDFVPVTTQNSSNQRNSDNTATVTVAVRGYDRALALFQDMVNQIREQLPDELWLNRLVEKFLTAEQEV